MATEALNDAGSSKTDITVILNDNEMSISKNVGGIQLLLSKLRTKKFYNNSNNSIKKIIEKTPYIGKRIVRLTQRTKKAIKNLIISNMYFEDIGFKYLGPVDGHNIEQLEEILEQSKELEGPVLIHVITKKGKGYKIAEDNPDKFHGVSAFNIETGETINKSKLDYSKVFGNKLVELAKKDNKIVAVTAAMKDGTGLRDFANEFPRRFFDVGITEQHAVGLIGGMAKGGLKPVFAVYSSFLQRAYDQLIHDIALQNLPVTICVDRAGIVGADGETHQGIFDLAFLKTIPNFVVMAPKNFEELEMMLKFAINLKKPVAIRYPRGGEGSTQFSKSESINLGKAEIIQEGIDITIVAIGKMVALALEISKELKKNNIEAEVINARFLKPLDRNTILSSVEKTKNVITIEDGIKTSGLGEEIVNLINESELENIKVKTFGYDDKFIEHGTVEELERKYKINKIDIIKSIEKEILQYNKNMI